ncbi:hypothetical protein ACSNN9_04745 [Micromonospora sp. URMC 107]|uniref:hypothetical protein n=1 Tax=Micromonospora sp. URMC 107 TaxID=3423418 RepID=UPI003F1C094A
MTSFNITLVAPSTVASATEGPSDQDFESIVMELCSVLAETDCAFSMAGFGQDQWPVDVRYDLSTLVEQFPDLLSGIRVGGSAEVDMYGQGIERTIRFAVSGDRVEATCISRTGWVPDPVIEEVDYSELLTMLESVAFAFAKSLRMVWPQCAEMVPFADWLSGK